MGLKLCLVLLLLAMAVAPHSSTFLDEKNWVSDSIFGAIGGFWGDAGGSISIGHGRHLYSRRDKYLSYAALRKNNIPCGHRGASYYNCRKRQKANPYRRGCSAITQCARFTD